MGGLGQVLEEEGLATAQISLVREHTAVMRPPRALWVPFMLGRPLGLPDDPVFQKRVLRALLALLKAPTGPVLVDYPEDAPSTGADDSAGEGWVCPVSFPSNDGGPPSLAEGLRRELQTLRTWYDIGRERRGRTTVGASGLALEAVAAFLVAVAEGQTPPRPRPDLPYGEAVRLAGDDLKAFCYEAAMARPGPVPPAELDRWFWTQTTAARVLAAISDRCRVSDDPSMEQITDIVVPEELRSLLG